MKRIKMLIAGALSALMLPAVLSPAAMVNAQEETQNPSELLLGIFFNSQEDQSDTLYVSFNGTEFISIGVAFEDRNKTSSSDNVIVDPYVDYAKCLHDPALQYHGGFFWTMSGFTWKSGDNAGTFQPMLSYSKDLKYWSYPNAGGDLTGANVNSVIRPTQLPYGKDGKRDNLKDFDCAAPDLFIDDDGTGWIVACLGYYSSFHGNKTVDYMSPYIIKASNLQPGTTDTLTTENARAQMPRCSYSSAYPMNLSGATSKNYIDASIYKENGVYYLSIKRDGTICEIWKTSSLSVDSKWVLVCSNVVQGYEGPCLTKFNGRYMMYTDKIADYPYGASDGTTGIFVTESDYLSSGWGNTHRITTKTIDGKTILNRHGSVCVIKDKNVISKIMDIYRSKGGKYTPSPEDTFTGVKEQYGEYKVFKNGKVDTTFTGLNQAPNGKWYYFSTGVHDKKYCGIANSTNGKKYYVTGGEWDKTYTGLYPQDSVWYYINKGCHDTSYVGVAVSTNGQKYFVRGGTWDESYTGLAQYGADKKWYFMNKGRFSPSYNGVATSTSGGNKLFLVTKGMWDQSFTGLVSDGNGKYHYMKKGIQDKTYTGFAQSKSVPGKWFFVRNGLWDDTYTGLAKSTDGQWYYAKNGRYESSYTGLAVSTNGKTYFVKSGKWDNNQTGLVPTGKGNGTYSYVKAGCLDTTYTGIARSINGGLYFVKNGNWDKTYTGLSKYTDGKWYYVKDGRHSPSYTGMSISTNGKLYFVQNGMWKKDFTGLVPNGKGDGTYSFVQAGRKDTTYSGMADSINGGIFYVNKGDWDKTYTGLAKHLDGKWYYSDVLIDMYKLPMLCAAYPSVEYYYKNGKHFVN